MTDVRVGRIAVEAEGPVTGDRPAVMLVHGLGGSSNSFQTLMPALAGWRAIRPDLPGSARTPRAAGQPDLAALVRAVIEVTEALGVARVHLVGHSMGTLVCQYVAAERPGLVASLTLFGPILEPTEAARERLEARAQAARRDGMSEIAGAVAEAGVSGATRSGNPVAAAFIRESHMRQDPEGFAWSCEALARAQAADHRRIDCPVWLATGDEDQVAPPSMARQLAERIRAAQVTVVERAGHWLPLENPVACRDVLRGALSQ